MDLVLLDKAEHYLLMGKASYGLSLIRQGRALSVDGQGAAVFWCSVVIPLLESIVCVPAFPAPVERDYFRRVDASCVNIVRACLIRS